MSGPRIEYKESTVAVEGDQVQAVVPPGTPGDGSVFVSVVSYRDGERCGATLKSIFENAKNPGKVFVGLVESNHADDKFCLEVYCASYGVTSLTRQKVRTDVVKIMTMAENRDKCPHYHQVKYLAFHKVGAKGPIYARSLTRKLLGNEEYCMQMDAHSAVVQDWDVELMREWQATHNEFAVLSTVPPKMGELDLKKPGGEQERIVPRMCQITFRDNGFPDYEKPADGVAHDLERPLLSHGWSAAFSFAKCHLEEAVPYDPFSYYAMPIEQFGRYARMWTRGYDTYTPTRNYVFHDYGDQPNGHGNLEWFKNNQKQRFRAASIERVKLMLEIPMIGEEGNNMNKDERALVTARANLGLYGLGKRRPLEELQKFAHVNFLYAVSNAGKQAICMHNATDYVVYDATISPYENLHDKPNDLDPQPEFPLRTIAQVGASGGGLASNAMLLGATTTTTTTAPAGGRNKSRLAQVLDLGVFGQLHEADGVDNHEHLYAHHDLAAGAGGASLVETSEFNALPPFSVLFVLWVFGLVVWAVLYMNHTSTTTSSSAEFVQSTKRAVQRKILQTIKTTSHKDV